MQQLQPQAFWDLPERLQLCPPLAWTQSLQSHETEVRPNRSIGAAGVIVTDAVTGGMDIVIAGVCAMAGATGGIATGIEQRECRPKQLTCDLGWRSISGPFSSRDILASPSCNQPLRTLCDGTRRYRRSLQ